ncbi:MAG: hypothetical protein DME46_10790 [Verrucomicrobia bacterium]|nr:MAG: hypothetical protein DME46_10790 [Verrucomicrobiota bacterium]
MKKPIRGSCLCGGVRFEVDPPFLQASHCHCDRCRKHSGAAVCTQTRVLREQFRLLQGNELNFSLTLTVSTSRLSWWSTTTLGFGHNFIPMSIAAHRGIRSQTIFRNIPNGEFNRGLRALNGF